ncbi:hypothetical protein NDU88_004750 [Pleurodeles waltl]|uniref:Uncharacterized protein n=1 Tax=Pleurodeles waltl TaxID=8319 RepID=A0AAV7RGJ1_PLEWA|nr:hypothetical protein NDU88_004750 [Pleurodeles waltl]
MARFRSARHRRDCSHDLRRLRETHPSGPPVVRFTCIEDMPIFIDSLLQGVHQVAKSAYTDQPIRGAFGVYF